MKSLDSKSLFPVALFLFCILFVAALYMPKPVFAVCLDENNAITPCNGAPDGSTGIPVNGTQVGGTGSGTQVGGTGSGTQVGGTSGQSTQSSAQIQNPLNGINSVSDFIKKLLQAVVVIGVPIAALFIILAGFKFITAQGSPDELAVARRNFIHVVIGVAIFIGAWALSELIVATLRSAGIPV